METSIGFMAVFAVSGSVVLIARQAHKRLVSDFMKKIEFEFGRNRNMQFDLSGSKNFQEKKKVKFAENVMEPSSNNKEYRRRRWTKPAINSDHHRHQQLLKMEEDGKLEDTMPLNRQVLYKGILEYKTLLKGTKM